MTSGPEGVTTYFLENYSEELAEENEIVLQDSNFSREYCVNLCNTVWGDLWKAEQTSDTESVKINELLMQQQNAAYLAE